MHGSKMNPCTTKDRNVVGDQNDPPLESPSKASPKAAAEKARFQPGNPGYEMRNNARAQNEHAFKTAQTANTTALILLNPDRSCDK
jgi:hypothetical protein